MLGVGERAYGVLDVLPATLVVERAPNRRGDEHAALTPTHPAVESAHDLIVQTYVQTHGHTLAHAVRPAFYRVRQAAELRENLPSKRQVGIGAGEDAALTLRRGHEHRLSHRAERRLEVTSARSHLLLNLVARDVHGQLKRVSVRSWAAPSPCCPPTAERGGARGHAAGEAHLA